MRIKLECIHADTCLPGYWGGHHLAHIAVPVDRRSTFKSLRESLRDELRQGAVMGNDDIARMLSADMVRPDEEAKADSVTRAAYAAINRDVVPAKKGARNPFKDVGLSDDCEDSVYAYFVFRECDHGNN